MGGIAATNASIAKRLRLGAAVVTLGFLAIVCGVTWHAKESMLDEKTRLSRVIPNQPTRSE